MSSLSEMIVFQAFTRRFPLLLRCILLFSSMLAGTAFLVPSAQAQQDPPYFVTYSSALEEPGNLEIENQNLTAAPKGANAFFAPTVELEYGTTAWWTTEFYLQGQTTANDSSVFTGFRLENRFRPLPSEHWINPVFYIEYENVNEADKSILEVTGNDSIADQRASNAVLRSQVARSAEGKLILSSNAKGWNFSENIISEKKVNSSDPWEFGYALAAARPLLLAAGSERCTFCRQNMALGAEMFGGLGTRYSFGLKDTEHYVGPTFSLATPLITYKFSPEFGLNGNSAGVLWRFGASYEIQQFRDWFRREK